MTTTTHQQIRDLIEANRLAIDVRKLFHRTIEDLVAGGVAREHVVSEVFVIAIAHMQTMRGKAGLAQHLREIAVLVESGTVRRCDA